MLRSSTANRFLRRRPPMISPILAPRRHRRDRPALVVDPHGDLATQIVRMIPPNRTNDVIVFDPADHEFAVSFNPLACRDPTQLDQVVSSAVSAFRRLFESWGPRLENTLRNTFFVTAEQGGTLLTALRPILVGAAAASAPSAGSAASTVL